MAGFAGAGVASAACPGPAREHAFSQWNDTNISDGLISRAREPMSRLAARVARRLGLSGDALDEVSRATELRDIGKLAPTDVAAVCRDLRGHRSRCATRLLHRAYQAAP